MSLPQHITYGEGGTVYIDLQTRPTSVTVTIEKSDGSDIVIGKTATINSVNTTLSGAASQGAATVSVVSASNIANGQVLYMSDDPEHVLVQSVNGTTVTLRRPLMKNHISGAAFQGTRASYTVSSSDAGSLMWDGRIKWTVDNVIEWSEIECTKYPLRRRATIQDAYDRQPKLYEILDSEVDTERLLDLGHEEVLSRIGAKHRARVYPGSMSFISATVLAALMLYYEHQPTEQGTVLYERYTQLLQEELERVTEIIAPDSDQDGKIEATDRQAFSAIVVRRA